MFNAVSPRPGEAWGVGIWPGPSGYLVLDPDVKNGEHGDDELAALEAEHGELDTLRAVTASGGAHVYLKKPAGVHIGNADLADGVNVRADDGWVVAISTRTPWGSWDHDDATPRDAIDCPRWLLDRLGSTNGNGSGKGHWSELDRSKLHPADLACLEAAERLGGHDAYIGGDGYVMIVSPHKTAGGSASIGHIGPGVMKVFTDAWPGLAQNGIYDADQLAEIARDTTGIAVTVVTLDEFAAVDEPGAEALLGDPGDAVIPAGSDVMFYGDGGAGKTTLTIDLGCHLAAGDDWLGITVARPLTVLLLENEGPRALFRVKLARKKAAWAGSPLGGRVRVVETPWATLSFAEEADRHALAKAVADHGCDLVMVGPLACSGMTEAGTLAEVRAFLALVDDVRRRSGRAVTFLLVHHPNKAGTPSGAWEGAGDTLVHVQGMGHGRTRLHFQKARWATTWHARTLDLNWTDGESYEVEVKPEITDDDIAASITGAIAENPGSGWSRIEEFTPGLRAERRRTIRDRLLTDGTLVNIVKENGELVALDHCPPRRPAQLHLASDPTITHLRPDPDAAGTQTASPKDGGPTASASLRPDSNRDADAGEPSTLLDLEEAL